MSQPTFVVVSSVAHRPPFLRRLIGRPTWFRLAVVPLFSVVTVVLPALLRGDAMLAGGVPVHVDDARSLLRIQREGTSPAEFPLLRDYATLVHIVMITLLLWLLPRAWARIDDLLPTLESRGCLRWRNAKAKTVAEGLLQRSNDNRLSSERSSLTLAGAGLLALVGSLGYQRYGVFRLFAPEAGATAWSRAAYADWWARPFDLPSFGWILLALLGNYLILWNARVTIGVVWFFVQNRDRFELDVDRNASDSFYGWSEVRELYLDYAWIMAIFGLGIAGFGFIASAQAIPYLLLFVLLFVVGVALMIVPLVMFKRMLRTARARWSDDLQDRRTRSGPELTMEAVLVSNETAALRGLPSGLLPVQRVAFQAFVALLPAIVVAYALAELVLT